MCNPTIDDPIFCKGDSDEMTNFLQSEPKKKKSKNHLRRLKICTLCKWEGYIGETQFTCPMSTCNGSVELVDVEIDFQKDMNKWNYELENFKKKEGTYNNEEEWEAREEDEIDFIKD